jgi:AraC-like DNA-binding protein
MMKTAACLPETTDLAGTDLQKSRDPLDDALEDLRITGTVLLQESYPAPWAVSIPDEARLRELLGVRNDVRVMPFHLARRRAFDLQLRGEAPVRVSAPEVVICLKGQAHRLSNGQRGKVVPFERILAGGVGSSAREGVGQVTEMICGVFMTRCTPLNPLQHALPSILKISTGDASLSPALAGTANLLSSELDRGSRDGFTVARLLEVFCAEAIRAYQRGEGALTPGWFRGLSDPKVANAIAQVHGNPAKDWTVELLATSAALSPSRFAARFRDTIGVSVMSYVAGWRINIACRLLRDTDMPLSVIAHQIGYESLPSFSRAFKARVGTPPAVWRARQP